MRREGMTTRKCGCVRYDYGPPLLCSKHEQREQEQEEKGLRKLVREQCAELGHASMTRWAEYESLPGKWTCHCVACGLIAIVYDTPPPVGDQVLGWVLKRRCSASALVGLGTDLRGGDDE